MRSKRWTRRQVVAAGALGTAGLSRAAEGTVYSRIGARPFINLTATYTINGGALSLPEVKRAMEEASHFPVNLDELMESVGKRLTKLLGGERAIVTAGCAAALAHATAACITGGDPEKMQQLPKLDGLRDQVIMPKQSRNVYDHAIRMTGVTMVEIETREELERAIGPRTAMMAVLGTGEPKGKVRLEEIVSIAKRTRVPVLVDAAAELPVTPNPYLTRGADLVAYSGGKFLRGPQCAGILLGRDDLVQAAWLNSSPHHAFGRAMKVGKEEIMGMLAAIEVWKSGYDLNAEYKKWESWYAHISEVVGAIPGVKTNVRPPAGASPFPVLEVVWTGGLTAGEVGQMLLNGQPRIMSHAEGSGTSFIIRPVAMQPGEYKIVAKRLAEILREQRPVKASSPRPPAINLAGEWQVDLQFVAGASKHTLTLSVDGNKLSGTHTGRITKGAVSGEIDGDKVTFRSSLPYEGTRLVYEFSGAIINEAMGGEVGLGEYGKARWSARRV